MVQAIIDIEERTNRVLNIVKAKYGLKDKSEAIDVMAKEYEEEVMEPELRFEYVKKMQDIEKKGKFIKYRGLEALKKEIENA